MLYLLNIPDRASLHPPRLFGLPGITPYRDQKQKNTDPAPEELELTLTMEPEEEEQPEPGDGSALTDDEILLLGYLGRHLGGKK